MAKKNDITVSEMRALLPWFLAVNAVYFALLLVLFFACENRTRRSNDTGRQ